LHTCTIITGEPNELVAQIHTRMPVILAEEHHEAWLSNQAGKEVLVPFPAAAMRAWPISPEGGKDSGKKHTDRRIKPRLVIMKALGVVPMAPAFGWN
jgi:putative SOS response-associated peptidase YedK